MPSIALAKKRKRPLGPSNEAGRKKNRNGKSAVKAVTAIPDQPEIDDQGRAFVDTEEIGDYAFLQHLNASQLGKRVEKQTSRPKEQPAKAILVPNVKSDEEIDSDEDGLSDVISDALDNSGEDVQNWDEEQSYELKPRKGGSEWRKKESTRLPVRTATGKLRQAEEPISESESESETEESDSDDEEDVEKTREIAPEEKPEDGPEAIIEAKEALARLAEEIAESPEEKVSNLKTFREIFNKGNAVVKKLALVSQLTVYKDIIPGYRIRPLTDTEKTAKVSKEVKQLRSFEESLLSNYKAYIASLLSITKSNRSGKGDKSLGLVAVTCAGSLLVAAPHFNFRTEILKVLVAQLSRRNPDEKFLKAREALETLFREDEDGNASLEALSILNKMIKARNYNVHPSLIQSFVHLRLLTELSVKASTETVENLRYKKKDRVFRTKKERKDLKERKQMEKEMAEADTQVSAEERERLQSEALKLVFGICFRTLKANKSDAMLSVVLDGIARFARLINAEFFGDLLEVLREILEGWDSDDASRNRTRDQLVCINAAFALLANQDGPTMELSYFVKRFVDLLPALSLSASLGLRLSPEEKSLLELIARVVDAIVFSPPIPASPTTIFTLYKRLLTCTLHLEEKEAAAFLKISQRMGARFEKKLEGMWDGEGAGVGSGNRVSGWELALLKRHYCKRIHDSSMALKNMGTKATEDK